MKIKQYLSKRELTALLSRCYNSGFLPCDKYRIGYDPINNRYGIQLLKDGDLLRITLATNQTLDLTSIRKQLDYYLVIKSPKILTHDQKMEMQEGEVEDA